MSSSGATWTELAGRRRLLMGAGGHARVLLDAMLTRGVAVAAVLDPDERLWGRDLYGVAVVGGDDRLARFDPADVAVVIGVGGFDRPEGRMRLARTVRSGGFTVVGVRHAAAAISARARLDPSAQLLAGTVVNAGAVIGRDAIVNSAAVVEHDCVVGADAQIASGTVLAGGAIVDDGARVGAGATVLPGVRIGPAALVGAGAVVARDVPAGARVAGVPARSLRRDEGVTPAWNDT